jgi:hypothetical protein
MTILTDQDFFEISLDDWSFLDELLKAYEHIANLELCATGEDSNP